MTISVLQERETSVIASVSTISIALLSPVTAGSSLHSFAAVNDAQTCTVDDNVNGTHGTFLDSIDDAGDGELVRQFKFDSSASGTITVKNTASAATGFAGIWAREIGGTSGYDGAHHANLQLAPGTGANALTSLTATPSVQPGLLSAMSTNIDGNSTPVISAGFTTGLAGWSFGLGTNSSQSESKRYTALSAIAATFTATTGADNYATLAAFFKEIGSGPTVNTKSIAEALATADSEPAFSIRNRLPTDALIATDSQTAFTLRTRGIIDSLVAADILTRFALHSRALGEAIIVIDLLTAVKSGGQINTKSLTESLVLSDQLAQFKLLWRAAIDPLSPADVESRYVLSSRQQTDAALITDTAQSFVLRNRAQSDAIGMTDIEKAFRILNRQVQDPFAIIDILVGLHTGSQIHTLSIVDTLSAIDQLLKVRFLTRAQLDSFPVLEAIISQFIPFINPSSLTRVHVELGMYDSVYLSALDPVKLGANDPIYLSSAA